MLRHQPSSNQRRLYRSGNEVGFAKRGLYLSSNNTNGIKEKPCAMLCFLSSYRLLDTPSIPEIIWVKNVRAIVVCGFLMKSSKKHILKI